MNNEITINIKHLLTVLKRQAIQTGYFMCLYKASGGNWEITRNPYKPPAFKSEYYSVSPDGLITDDGGNEIVLK